MDPLNTRIAHRLRALRDAAALSLDSLADRSGVSRSAIAQIESGQGNPTATVLDRLSAALGSTVAALFEPAADGTASPPSPFARVADQPVWTDPGSGYRRRNVSPPGVSPLQLVDVIFPPGRRVAYDDTPRAAEVHQQVWMIDGRMDVSVGAQTWQLHPGDCLAMRLDAAITYRNPGRTDARYLVALVPGEAPSLHRRAAPGAARKPAPRTAP